MLLSNEKSVTFSSVPGGRGCVIITYIIAAVVALMGIMLSVYGDDIIIGIGILCVFLFVFVPLIVLMYYHNCDSYVRFVDDKIYNNRKTLTWDNACLTAHCHGLFGSRAVFIWIYFDDHYLTEREICSFRKRRQCLCLRMNDKRLQFILAHCKNKIKVLNDNATEGIDILLTIYMFNDSVSSHD